MKKNTGQRGEAGQIRLILDGFCASHQNGVAYAQPIHLSRNGVRPERGQSFFLAFCFILFWKDTILGWSARSSSEVETRLT